MNNNDYKNILLVSMPFSEIAIPSIQLCLLKSYLKERNIEIDASHLYLTAADIYGLKNYKFLLNSKAGSYSSQMGFSKYVFPDYFNDNKDKFREFYDENIFSKENNLFDFDKYLQKTDDFHNKIIKDINWKKYDLVGFSLNYSQFLSSLAVAKKIKEKYPYINSIFGGSRTVGEIGKNVLKTFDYIDFIVSGDGEESLYQLAINENPKQVENLSYRDKKEIISNNTCFSIDINNLPVVDFDSFYKELKYSSPEIQQYYHVYGRLPIEISRGCWWNKCTFCNLNIQYKNYREKKIEKIIDEINFLSDKYKMLKFQIIGNTLPLNNYKELCKEILKIGKDFSFIAENRTDRFKGEDYSLLKKAGFTTIQSGIESFSPSYLKKMCKGVKVIDNIAALKFCKENNIINNYNIIVNYPNEEENDFLESKKNISFIKQYIDPPNIVDLVIGFGSTIFNNPKDYNIEYLDHSKTDKLMFPSNILKQNISFFYSFNKKQDFCENNWNEILKDWKNERRKRVLEELENKNILDKLVFYFKDGKDFLKIYDKRNYEHVKVYMLDSKERELFLACIDVISETDLKERFKDMDSSEINKILNSFVEAGILYKEDEWFLSLPISYHQYYNKEDIKNTEDIKEIREYIDNL